MLMLGGSIFLNGTIERSLWETRKENKKEEKNEHLFLNIYNLKNANTYTLLKSLQGCQIVQKVQYVSIVET